MSRVVIGLSGGVDSSVAAYLLKQQGHDVVALFMVNWHDRTGTITSRCTWEDDAMIAEMVAKKLDIPFHIVDLSKDYKQRVVDYMFAEYSKGRTPNPDVLCNREIKFDIFLDECLKYDADFVATGHYCRKSEFEKDGQMIHQLLAGKDNNKDQSYFLCQLNQYQLSKAMFPIGHLEKPEVREIARQQNLPTAERKDSQGICFVGKVDLPTFLQQQLEPKTGNVIEVPAEFIAKKKNIEKTEENFKSFAPNFHINHGMVKLLANTAALIIILLGNVKASILAATKIHCLSLELMSTGTLFMWAKAPNIRDCIDRGYLYRKMKFTGSGLIW